MLQYIPLCNNQFLIAFIKFVLLSGRHCCLYCEISKEEMKIARYDKRKSTLRTLQTSTDDYKKFTSLGSNIKNAKLCNNVIDKFMFNIPNEQVITNAFFSYFLRIYFLSNTKENKNSSNSGIHREHHVLKN